ncbi:hypothetical protein GGR95_003716 [Sulfitobacter undariae]|uniref:Uncharacterized protein n=1 Tax=Sulfitobacter undariae TaxID=1563671 RepID=A0A7W6H1Z2_9RHOB|nr:hypothetical protein [Sulfitobacter undariae]
MKKLAKRLGALKITETALIGTVLGKCLVTFPSLARNLKRFASISTVQPRQALQKVVAFLFPR